MLAAFLVLLALTLAPELGSACSVQLSDVRTRPDLAGTYRQSLEVPLINGRRHFFNSVNHFHIYFSGKEEMWYIDDDVDESSASGRLEETTPLPIGDWELWNDSWSKDGTTLDDGKCELCIVEVRSKETLPVTGTFAWSTELPYVAEQQHFIDIRTSAHLYYSTNWDSGSWVVNPDGLDPNRAAIFLRRKTPSPVSGAWQFWDESGWRDTDIVIHELFCNADTRTYTSPAPGGCSIKIGNLTSRKDLAGEYVQSVETYRFDERGHYINQENGKHLYWSSRLSGWFLDDNLDDDMIDAKLEVDRDLPVGNWEVWSGDWVQEGTSTADPSCGAAPQPPEL